MSILIDYVKAILHEYKKDNIPILAAAQAYYYLLSIVPLLIVCFAIIPYLNMDPKEVMLFLEDVIPGGIAESFEEQIVNIVQTPKGGLLTFGIVGALWSASNGVNAFIKATNEAYGIDETRSFIMIKFIALTLTVGVFISFAVALLLPVFGSVNLNLFNDLFHINTSIVIALQLTRWIVSILVIILILLVLYRFAPNKKLPIKHILPGAISASTLWLIISLGFSLYVSNFGSYTATYGSLGGIIILMIWFYLTGLTLMIGAEINVIHQRRHTRST